VQKYLRTGGGGQSGEGLLLAIDIMDVGLGLLKLFTLLELLLFVGVCKLRLKYENETL